ncbi:uncharacterized protein V1516DRAFT_685039 [Lipomyces oligophaga]|uniref:uncharacterized protein n=1 Tax=Lipomyces oligophaga TaxID=45792 RepID=UPI0034CF2207
MPPGPNHPGTVTTASGITLNMTAAMARSSGISLRTGRPKRKKASRACFHCQKAHLTCDDARPCQRCIKRGLSATCQDGVRKKAKYLNDGVGVDPSIGLTTSANDDLVGASNSHSGSVSLNPASPTASILAPPTSAFVSPSAASATNNPLPSPISTHETINPNSLASDALGDDPIDSSDSLFSNLDLSSYNFGSKTANMEFSYLSNMIDSTNGINAQDQIGLASSEAMIATNSASGGNSGSSFGYGFADIPVRDASWATRGLASLLSGSGTSPQNSSSPPTPTSGSMIDTTPDRSAAGASQPPLPHRSSSLSQELIPSANQPFPLGTSNLAPPQSTQKPVLSGGLSSSMSSRRRRDPETVYASVTQPFSYTPGYHGLIAYLKSRFDRPHLMRVARCMASFRPSFIACTKTLKEEDLIFMEKCFQRTLLEYEKFISYSGTPTIVWRRTGQIAAVGKEFCILTGWTREQLLSKRTFVVELMDDHSVLEYFEGFSKLAFGDSRGATMMECTLLSPSGSKVPTACTWTIKRDVFDIPMMIVGNFLPILN